MEKIDRLTVALQKLGIVYAAYKAGYYSERVLTVKYNYWSKRAQEELMDGCGEFV